MDPREFLSKSGRGEWPKDVTRTSSLHFVNSSYSPPSTILASVIFPKTERGRECVLSKKVAL